MKSERKGRFSDLTGQRFGRLVVVSKHKHPTRTEAYWKCSCDCGQETIVSGGCLRRGDTKSCGCYNQEVRQAAWPRGEASQKWKGGRSIRKDGYVTVYTGEKTHNYEHIVVMERKLGRKLSEHETVHHKNGIRDDNREDNLELWTSSHPAGQRIEDKVEWATNLLRLYAPERLK